jgi:hypothetical protein
MLNKLLNFFKISTFCFVLFILLFAKDTQFVNLDFNTEKRLIHETFQLKDVHCMLTRLTDTFLR